MNYATRIKDYVTEKGRTAVLAATIGASVLLGGGCKTPEQRAIETYEKAQEVETAKYEKNGVLERLTYAVKQVEDADANKDGEITPAKSPGEQDELRNLIKASKRLENLLENPEISGNKESDHNTEAKAAYDAAQGMLEEVAESNDYKTLVIFAYQHNGANPNSSVNWFGLYEDNGAKLNGDVCAIAKATGLRIEDLLRKVILPFKHFGYDPETPIVGQTRIEMTNNTIRVPKGNWCNLAKFVPEEGLVVKKMKTDSGEIREEECVSLKELTDWVKEKKIIDVRLAVKYEPGEK